MENRNIIVIGASAGGTEALSAIVEKLPADLNAAVFIVWHMSPDVRGILPTLLSSVSKLPVEHAVDWEPIKMGQIYVAPPDHHMLVEKEFVRVTRGPKENRFRPAVDPLFRSAAFSHGRRVIGIVLSGALDDGSSGLWSIKNRGGLAIVQDPLDAKVSSMPASAMRAVDVDHVLPVSEIGPVLVQLVGEPVTSFSKMEQKDTEKLKREVNIAEGADPKYNPLMEFGSFSPYSCPECNGVLSRLKEGGLIRFRCHTGHAFSLDSLLAALTENVEENLAKASRSIQERILLLNHIGDHLAEENQVKLAAAYFQEAKEAMVIADRLHQVINRFNPEPVNGAERVGKISGTSQ